MTRPWHRDCKLVRNIVGLTPKLATLAFDPLASAMFGTSYQEPSAEMHHLETLQLSEGLVHRPRSPLSLFDRLACET